MMEEEDDSDRSENLDESEEELNLSSTLKNGNQRLQSVDPLHPRKKRKRKEGGRKRIRKILTEAQLESETVSAQKEEQERLRRLELQKSLSAVPSGSAARITPPLGKSSPSLDTGRPSAQPVIVNVPSKQTDPIIVIDDSDDDDDDVVWKSQSSDCVIEISDSEAELSDDDDDDEDKANEEPENSGSHTNDDVNQPDVEGRVLVNVNHPPSEPDIFLPSHLCRCVKPHQIGGIRFLYDNLVESLSRYQMSPGFGCILAHSMGLGKTLQVICFIDVFLRYTEAKKVLCIVPMNTIQNWYNEFNTWLPDAATVRTRAENLREGLAEEGDGQEKQGRTFQVLLFSENLKTTVARSALIAKWEKEGGVLLMGYEMYRILAMYTPSLVNNTKLTGSKRRKTNTATTEVIDLDEEEKNMDLLLEIQKSICKPGPDLIVCDEGHRIKNSQANISHALKKIHTRSGIVHFRRRVVLTGYPLQNNLMEYWCMVDFVRPNFLGTKHEFSNMFERPIINGQCVDSTASDIKLMRFRAHVLHSLLEGFVQRRSEAVLTTTLPAKEEYVIPVKMTPIQMALYRAFVTSVQNYVGYINPIKAFGICIKIWNHPDILKSYLDSKKDANRNDSPLTVCDSDLDIGELKKTKADANKLQTSEVTLCPPDNRAMTNAADWVGDLMVDYKTGILQHGAKVVLLMEIIEKSVQMGDKILVFSQSLSTLSLIEDFLRKRVVPPLPSQIIFQPVHWEKNKNYYRLDGGTSSQEREKLMSAFNSKSNNSVFVFLLSTRACSLGVNLIGANRVVIFDASWNPCHDAQAVCRIYRYGQTKKCFIYRLVSHGTFEKRMYERQVTKEGMSDRVIDELNPEANLTKQEVMHLFKEAECNENEGVPEFEVDSFADPVLNHVCGTCRGSISELPFKHKLQSSTQKAKNVLTKAEKREAKKGYEREKRAIDSANRQNGASSSSLSCFPQVREQFKKEVANRPVGHVKPIQNVKPSTFVRPSASSFPTPLHPPVNPFRPNLPSMASMPGLTFPPLDGRFYQVGELRPLSPYPVNFPMPFPLPGMDAHAQQALVRQANIEKANVEEPVVVNLLASPEEKQETAGRKVGDTAKADVAIAFGNISETSQAIEPQSSHVSYGITQVTSGVSQSTVDSSTKSVGLASGNSKYCNISNGTKTVSDSSLRISGMLNSSQDALEYNPLSRANGVVSTIPETSNAAMASNLRNTGFATGARGLNNCLATVALATQNSTESVTANEFNGNGIPTVKFDQTGTVTSRNGSRMDSIDEGKLAGSFSGSAARVDREMPTHSPAGVLAVVQEK